MRTLSPRTAARPGPRAPGPGPVVRGLWAPCALAVSLLAGCAPEGGPDLEQRADEIVNGSRDPRVMALLPGEIQAIGFFYSTFNPTTSFCTGTLIDGRHVLTARHCLQGWSAAEAGFGIGTEPANPDARFQIESIAHHPTEDLCLVTLAEDARRALPTLRPIPFNRADLDGPAGQALMGQAVDVAGFGQTFDASRTGRWFAEVYLAEITRRFAVIDGRGRQGVCEGDSGGPLIVPDAMGLPVTLGVLLGGDESCVNVDYYTRVDPLLAWLDGHLRAGGEDCGDLDYQGTCVDQVAVWCDDYGRVARRDCAAEGQGCGLVGGNVGYYCQAKDGRRADDPGRLAAAAGPPPRSLEGGCQQVPGPPPLAALAALVSLWGLRRRRRAP